MRMNASVRRGSYTIAPRARASSALVLTLACSIAWSVALAPSLAPSLAAQDTTRVAADSLAERLRRAEEAIALLREQLAAQAASSVQSASRVQVELYGRVMMNAFSNRGSVNNADVPLFALPDTGSASGGAGATIRQTSLGLAVAVPRVLGGDFAGDLHLDFFGGQVASSGGRHRPLVRLRTAYGTVRWRHAELLFGQESPLVAGVSPASLAAFGYPDFTAAGNLWQWLPQLRVTGEVGAAGGAVRIGLQGAVLAPASGDPLGPFDTDVDRAERSKRPFLQARLRAQWGTGEGAGTEPAGEIGIGVHRGSIRRDDGSRVASEAVAADVRIALGRMVELRGEAYVGRAVRGLGGGGIGQLLTTGGAAIRDRGGWAQLIVKPSSLLELGTGCGVLDPEDAGLPLGRRRNVSCEAHATARPGGPLIFGLAYRRQETTYASGKVSNDHLNLATGFEF
ncbi:MAG: hypothetical protein WKG32_10760 [Gemmatimonadaceae bacterium]